MSAELVVGWDALGDNAYQASFRAEQLQALGQMKAGIDTWPRPQRGNLVYGLTTGQVGEQSIPVLVGIHNHGGYYAIKLHGGFYPGSRVYDELSWSAGNNPHNPPSVMYNKHRLQHSSTVPATAEQIERFTRIRLELDHVRLFDPARQRPELSEEGVTLVDRLSNPRPTALTLLRFLIS